jgi:5-formyltetrahydrofolate cyclo-ligase
VSRSDPDDRDALRARLREQRRGVAARQRIASAEALAEHLLSLTSVHVGGNVAGYWAMDGEIALHAWQTRLHRSTTYCLPVLHGRGLLRFAPWTPGAPLVTNRYGIPEPDVASGDLLSPEQLDLVVLPLVGFDAQGHRLGMGAGWYDRTFAFRQHQSAPPRLVGAAFAMQQVDALHAEPWDVPLDTVCTETGVIECIRGAQ